MPTKKSGITSVIEKGRNTVKKISSGIKSLFFICAASIAFVVDFVFDKLFLLIPALAILFIIIDYKSPLVHIDYGRWSTVVLLLIYVEVKLYFRSKKKAAEAAQGGCGNCNCK